MVNMKAAQNPVPGLEDAGKLASNDAVKPSNQGAVWKSLRLLEARVRAIEQDVEVLRKQSSRTERKVYRDVSKEPPSFIKPQTITPADLDLEKIAALGRGY